MGSHRILWVRSGVAPERQSSEWPGRPPMKTDKYPCKCFEHNDLRITAYTVMMPFMRTIAGRFQAAADETRLQILALLDRHGELCVCDVERALRISQSKASRHLRYLVSRGFLADRPRGIWVYYRVRRPLEPANAAVLTAVKAAVPPEVLAQLDQRLERWRSSGKRPAEDAPPVPAGGGR